MSAYSGDRLIKSSSSAARIYVGNLPQNIREKEIEDIFYKYGKIVAVDIHSRADPAFAFVDFEDPRDAEDAVHEKDGDKFESYTLKVEFPKASGRGGGRDNDRFGSDRGRGGYVRGRGRGGPIRRTDHRVLISGMPPSGSWQDLKDHMREAGEVTYTDVYKDGTATVEFGCKSDMEWAVKYLDDTKFKSHQNEHSIIHVKADEARGSRRSRSRSRSPRRRSPSPRRRSYSPRRRSRSRSPYSRR